MTVPFTRKLGRQPGVQLNPLRDNSDGFAPDNSDQVYGIAMRATRGRIDKPFAVNRGNFYKRLGRGESLRQSVLNEAIIHVFESLQQGASGAAVSRLITPAAVLSYVVASIGSGAVLGVPVITGGAVTTIAVTNGGTGYSPDTTVNITGGGTGAVAAVTVAAGVITAITVSSGGTGYTSGAVTVTLNNPVVWAVSPTLPVTPYIMAVKHLECFNDGLKLQLQSEALVVSGVNQPNPAVTLTLLDPYDSSILYQFSGSLDSTAVDGYNQSLYLPDVVDRQSGTNVEVTVGAQVAIPINANCYGRDASSASKVASSGTQVYFSEGGTGYGTSDYVKAVNGLRQTDLEFGYLVSGGSQSTALIGLLANFGIETNRQFAYDIPGNLTASAAKTWQAQVSFDSHYVQAYWAPLKTDDPMGINGKVVIGTATLNIAYRCARNAQRNSKGFAPKNFPVAGKDWALDNARTGITQIYTPTEPELDDLAGSQINPVTFKKYNGGGRYVFTDSLTCAKTDVSFRKLIAVAEMSSDLDNQIAGYGNEVIQKPMKIALKSMKDFMKKLLEGAKASDWLVETESLGGEAFEYQVVPNEIHPADQIDVSYTTRFDGTVRQVTITQTLSKA